MNKKTKTLFFVAAIGFSSIATGANAAINAVSGTGTLSSVGQEITGTFDFDSDTVDYTLTLNEISGISGINWNGTGAAQGGTNPGFQFDAGTSPSLTDTWTATLSFSKPVLFDWEQTVADINGNNNGASKFSMNWLGNFGETPTISDIDDQLEEEVTSVGQAEFRIATNPGVGTTANGGTVFNNSDTWVIEGVLASEVQLQWNAVATGDTRNEWITIDGESFSVPFEFSPTLGLLGVGSLFGVAQLRKKLNHKSLK